MIALHTRSICDECGNSPATVHVDETFFLCDRCEAVVINSFPLGFSSSPGVSVATVDCQPPAVATTLSVSDGVPASSLSSIEMGPVATLAHAPSESNPLEGSQAAVTASQPVSLAAVAVATNSDPELEALVSACESEWPAIPAFLRRSADNVPPFAIRAADISQNSITSRTFAASEIAPKFSVSIDDVSTSSFSVGA